MQSNESTGIIISCTPDVYMHTVGQHGTQHTGRGPQAKHKAAVGMTFRVGLGQYSASCHITDKITSWLLVH